MRLSAALKLIALLAVALAVGLVAAAKSMDFQRAKALISEQVQAATGRPLTIAGPLELRLGVVPRVIATGVVLGNAPGGSRPEMVKIERIEAEVALLPLLKREVRVQRLVVFSPDILLETDRAGRGNWSFASPSLASAVPASTAARDGAPAMRLTLREVRIKNARLFWRDGRNGSSRQANIPKIAVQADQNVAGRLAVQVVADTDGRVLEMGGRVDVPADAAKPWSLQAQGSFDGMVARAEGSVGDPLAARGMDLRLAVQGDELGKVVRFAGLVAGEAPPALGPFKLAGRLSDGQGALALTDLEVSAGRRDALLVSGRGAIKDVRGLGGVELALAVDSDTLAGLSRLTGTEVPPIGPLKLTGTLSGGGERWKLADIKATLAGSDAAGELALTLAGRPHLTGSLSANSLALADFTTPASKPGEKLTAKGLKADGGGRLFPADKLALAPLRALDAGVTLRASRLALAGVTLNAAVAEMHLRDGRLVVKPLQSGLAGGQVEGEASLDASGKVPALSLRLSARNVDLGRVVHDLGVEALTGGRTDARLDFRGQGESWRALMASSSGELVVGVGEGRLRNTAWDWAGGDLLVQLVGVLNPLSRSEDTTPLSCAALRFVVKDGVAVADRGIAVETARVNVVGAGNVDLRSEQLDLGITPRARDGLGLSLSAPLAGMTRLRGTLANPALSLSELGVARSAASAGAAVATGGLSLVGEALFDRLTADGNPCQTALGKVPEKKTGKGKGRKAEPGLLDGLFGR
ncbi:MAG: AsmA family protein [Magnetospirillum sp.]|nr:AsmA family protein [Magnetospirillum sp.]